MVAVIEDAERVLSIVLSRWKNEASCEDRDPTDPICQVLDDTVANCLLAFRIDDVERVSTDRHDAPKPISDYFLAQATLTLTPRPGERMHMASMRAQAVDPDIATKTYHVKRFTDGTWLVLSDTLA